MYPNGHVPLWTLEAVCYFNDNFIASTYETRERKKNVGSGYLMVITVAFSISCDSKFHGNFTSNS
jgi:hypothetical protein